MCYARTNTSEKGKENHTYMDGYIDYTHTLADINAAAADFCVISVAAV